MKKCNKHHAFLNPQCSARTIDNFLPRQAVLNALTEQLGNFQGTLLDLGCGSMPYKSIILSPPSRVRKYTGLDLSRDLRHRDYSQCAPPDLEWDGGTIPLDHGSIDCAIATEVFQQCPDVENVMREVIRVLKPGGLLFFTVPFLWALHNAPHDQYRFTPFALDRHLCNVGFEHIEMKALGGWDASLAQMIGLWVGRRPMRGIKRRMLSLISVPIVRYLIKMDAPPILSRLTASNAMITGISGTAIKSVGEQALVSI